jgi:uncharacterized iron-regulated protein
MKPALLAPLTLIAALLLAGCSGTTPIDAVERPAQISWVSSVARDHPLVGRFYDPSAGREVTGAQAIERLRQAKFLMLGEKHDNADHHLAQAFLLQAVTDAGRKPALVWEMIDQEQALDLKAFLAEKPIDAARMGRALSWERRGWPAWAMYRPIAEAALAAGLPMAPANASRAVLRRPAPSPAFSLPMELLDSLKQELSIGHCGMLPASALAGMATAQQRRDLAMADSLLGHATSDGAVLIAGAGHARRDRGAPWWLIRLGVDAKTILSVGMLEVDPAWRSIDDLKGLADQFDLLFLTPRVDLDDPCAKFAEQLKNLPGKP